MYHYFVSYQFNNEAGSGFGQVCVTATRAITTSKEIVMLNEMMLERDSTNTGIVILFFHLLRVSDEEEDALTIEKALVLERQDRRNAEKALTIAVGALGWCDATAQIDRILSREAMNRVYGLENDTSEKETEK